ncbi:MAG: hypothetical protein J6W06_06995, partial [Bacteroidales bacterium]|nr:hypothetical protein [Bacteroidales bacterium]
MIETWFNQDTQQAVKVRYIDGNVFSMDNNGNKIGVNMFTDGVASDVSGTISANVIRADGVTVAVTGSSSNNQAWVVLPQSAYVVPGVVSIIIKATSGSDVTTLCAVVGNVYRSSTDSVVDPGTILPSIETLLAEIEYTRSLIPAGYEAMWTTLAPAFDPGASYAPGQYCTYDGAMYRFINAHSGTWASGDVEAVTIGGSLTGNRAETETLTGTTNNILKLNNPTPIEWYVAKNVGIANATGAELPSSVFTATDFIDIRAFSSITYKRLYTTATSVNTGIAFYDASKTYISGVISVKNADTRHYEWYTPNMPANAAFVRCTMFKVPPEGETFDIYGTAKLPSTLATMQTDIEGLKAEVGSEADIEGLPVVIPYTFVPGYGIDGKTGERQTSEVFNCTNYVDIRSYCRINCKRVTVPSTSGNHSGSIAFYDSNKNFLYGINCKWNSVSGYEDQSLAFPAEVAYVRCSIRDVSTYGEYVITGYKR